MSFGSVSAPWLLQLPYLVQQSCKADWKQAPHLSSTVIVKACTAGASISGSVPHVCKPLAWCVPGQRQPQPDAAARIRCAGRSCPGPLPPAVLSAASRAHAAPGLQRLQKRKLHCRVTTMPYSCITHAPSPPGPDGATCSLATRRRLPSKQQVSGLRHSLMPRSGRRHCFPWLSMQKCVTVASCSLCSSLVEKRTQGCVIAGEGVQVRQLLVDLRGECLDRLLQAHNICAPALLHSRARHVTLGTRRHRTTAHAHQHHLAAQA